jgi:hypothetical protein
VGEGEPTVYDSESIYSYIDGHAEVYLAYGMKRCLSRRYSGPEGEPDIVVDLFELASPADAFGVFTQDRDGEELDIGRGALFRSGWLSFWKGPWFGSIYAEGDSPASRAAVLALGAAAAAAIDADGDPPALLARLPAAGLEPRSVRFLRTQEILNSVHFLGFDNPFELGPDVEAVVGRYRMAGGEGWLLIVRYPDQETAAGAASKAAAAGIAVRRDGSDLAGVLDPQPAAIAGALLDAAMGGDR